MALSLFSIQNAKAREKPYKLMDGDGLHLLVNPNGSKLWRLRYRFGGKQSMLALPQPRGWRPAVHSAGLMRRLGPFSSRFSVSDAPGSTQPAISTRSR
jgi:hypothetical protein